MKTYIVECICALTEKKITSQVEAEDRDSAIAAAKKIVVCGYNFQTQLCYLEKHE
jgi:hypothetical protein